MCREEAVDLCGALSGMDVPIVGIVKEPEIEEPVEDEAKLRGLACFEKDYFCGPLYLSDEARTVYEYLGNRPIFTWGTLGKALLNPFKVRGEIKALGERMKSKKIEGNLVGDGLIQGGVLCIAPDGELKYTFLEQAGKGIPAEAQREIVDAVRAFGGTKGVVVPAAVAKEEAAALE